MNRLPTNTRKALRGMTVDALLSFAEALASRNHDGHLAIFRQTTCWQAAFLPPVAFYDNHKLNRLPRSKSLRDALMTLIASELEVQS